MLDQDPDLPTALVDFPAPPGSPNKARRRWRFDRPARWLVAHDPSQVAGLLDAAHQLAQQGQWCVGWVAYEAAPGLNPHLPVKALPPGQPYAVWAVFDHAEPWDGQAIDRNRPAAPWHVGPWQGDLDQTAIEHKVEQIRELIRAGEVYQINLTGQQHSPFEGTPAALWPWFMALRRSQPQSYALMLDARAASRVPGTVLSVSPELFFDWDGQHITTSPMKGTAPRGHDATSDQAAADHLRGSDKERAENLMIVDLLRNDLSRVAVTGSVKVPALFDLMALPTVWQMTSTITADSRPGVRLSELFAALFPCGSVTGAPKRQAMHHIARLERSARGVYCGAVGIMQPGGHVTFNVPIRTLTVDTLPPPAPWRAHCGIGSGITLDATGPGEAREWEAKKAFLVRANHPFQLLESLRLEDGVIQRQPRHLARVLDAARHFCFATDDAQCQDLAQRIDTALQDTARAHVTGVHKVRLLVDDRLGIQVEAAPLPTTLQPVRVALAQQAMPPADAFIWHKTTRREAYVAFKPPQGCFDTLLYNAQQELTEFTIGNLALKLDGIWYTPPVSCGLLPGVMRATLLDEGVLQERVLHLNDLPRAEGLALLNSVRGWLDVDQPSLSLR